MADLGGCHDAEPQKVCKTFIAGSIPARDSIIFNNISKPDAYPGPI
jgi:hypothetical protein